MHVEIQVDTLLKRTMKIKGWKKERISLCTTQVSAHRKGPQHAGSGKRIN